MKSITLELLIGILLFIPLNLHSSDIKAGTTNWYFNQIEGGKGKYSSTNGMLTVEVVEPGNRPWSVILGQGKSLEKNSVYSVSFNARSHDVSNICLTAMMNAPPYTYYSGLHIFKLTGNFKKFTFLFSMRQPDDPNAQLQFYMGRSGKGRIDITDVRILWAGYMKKDIIPRFFQKPPAGRIEHGINLGDTLEAPYEGAWAPELREEYFDLIKNCGSFDHIRIPVRWDTHVFDKAAYTIDPAFMQRVDWAVSQALKRGFYVILNMHHYDGLETDSQGNHKEFLEIWKQIARKFKDYPGNLYFEIYNEPQRNLNSFWNSYFPEVYDIIRKNNPDRKIVISCQNWAQISSLDQLILPERVKKDKNVIIQFHFYNPPDFCFQGSIGNGFENAMGIRWTGTAEQKKELARLADFAVEWAKRNGGKMLYNG
ncbi:MAG: cellulase family glycosylhydrolase, partial [Brevinematales bacterium]